MLRRHFSPSPLPSPQIQALVSPCCKCSTHTCPYSYFCTVSSHNLGQDSTFSALSLFSKVTILGMACEILPGVSPLLSHRAPDTSLPLHSRQTLAFLQALVHTYFLFSQLLHLCPLMIFSSLVSPN